MIDENEIPVPQVYIKSEEGEGVFSDDSGDYTLITRDFGITEGRTFSLKKEGYSLCYTFSRQGAFFDTFGDLTIISKAGKDAMYTACGKVQDITKGTIAGIVVDRNDQALSDAEVFTETPSGSVYYLDANNSPNLSLTNTGHSGKFVILNVAPGIYRISANRDGYTFDVTDDYGATHVGPFLQVCENATTVDALVGNSESDDEDSSGGDGGGDGGGCFIATAAYGSYMQPHVKILREFRDRFLLTNAVGKVFIDLYTTYSPPLANFIANHGTVRFMVRWSLLPLVAVSWMSLSIGLIHTFTIILLMLILINIPVVVVFRRIQMRIHRT